ncbi:MAG: hypothetical protein QNK40_09275 [Desulfobacterales bacterium]|nr:hypothetical protein [Desulfobacterales bacterium]
MIYREQYHPAVKKDLKKIDSGAREKIRKEWIPKLLLEPQGGKELAGPLMAFILTISRLIKYIIELPISLKKLISPLKY